ncbi:hypothetical protein GXB78_01710 [Pseudomonas moraviensis subsp. stanleyae]|uniref:hypothetical protein n=1 Tax=Pseudomonas moraviensis TaxID=321662 RepID=UPI002E30A642|nr:hypothetical protein [Pseudomonas moraviensis]MED7665927.1 hypothetical protein [Pseudomonas moraviensis subsp. stanleyae]
MDTQTPSKPAEDSDAPGSDFQIPLLDKAFEFIQTHNWKLFRIASLAFGFLIFLIYFCQNRFYPDFDLFSFLSLLTAAALFGGLIVLLIGFGFSAPGWIWSQSFFRDKPVCTVLEAAFCSKASKEDLDRRLINHYFFAPGFCCLAFFWTALYLGKGFDMFMAGLLLGPLIVGLLFGSQLQRKYALPSYSWLKFTLTAFVVFSIGNLIAFFTAQELVKQLPEASRTPWEFVLRAFCFTASLFLFALVAAIIRSNHRYVLIVGPLVAIVLMLWSNTWGVLPEKIVRLLGLGNYQAEQVLLSNDLCEKYKAIEGYGIKSNCALNDVHVIWSMGSTTVMKWQFANQELKVKIPSSSILSTRIFVPKASPEPKPLASLSPRI